MHACMNVGQIFLSRVNSLLEEQFAYQGKLQRSHPGAMGAWSPIQATGFDSDLGPIRDVLCSTELPEALQEENTCLLS